jgi:Trk-type K+ transport system membrane component
MNSTIYGDVNVATAAAAAVSNASTTTIRTNSKHFLQNDSALEIPSTNRVTSDKETSSSPSSSFTMTTGSTLKRDVLLDFRDLDIEKQLVQDKLLDDGEMAPAKPYESIEVSNHIGGLWKFLKHWCEGTGDKHWKQQYFFIIHVVYILGMGLLYGFLVYLIERDNYHWTFIDSMYIAFSALCLSGFIVHPIDRLHGATQFILWIAMISGGLTLTAIPPLLVKIYRAKKRMIAKRKEKLLKVKHLMAEHSRALVENGINSTTIEHYKPITIPLIEKDRNQLFSPSNPNENASPSPIAHNHNLLNVNTFNPMLNTESEISFEGNTCCNIESRDFGTMWSSSNLEDKETEYRQRRLSEEVRNHVANNDDFESIPLTDIEYTALTWLLILTLCLVIFVNLTGWILISLELELMKDALDRNNPWWVSAFITVSAFNNVGMSLFTDSMFRFVHNVPICLLVSFLIIIGNTAMPIILRLIIFICYKFSKRYKLVFKYMLEKHHHLSLHLYPGLQTRAYAIISLLLLALGVFTPLALDNNNGAYKNQPFGTQLLISFFQACSARIGGFQTIDLGVMSLGTVCVYLLMMRIKAQMACGLQENAYKIMDVVRKVEAKEKHEGLVSSGELEHMIKKLPKRMLHKDKNKKGEIVIYVKEIKEEEGSNITAEQLFSVKERSKNFLSKLWKHFIYHTKNLFGRNNAWLVLTVMLICVSESSAALSNPAITLEKIVFEVFSAFGNVGLSLGVPGSPLAFSSILNPFSKLLIILTMITGRHRGWYGSMVDQQEDQYNLELTNKSLVKQMMRVSAKREKHL